MGGGGGKLTLIFTCAIVWIGTRITNAKKIVPKSNFFILLPPSPRFWKWYFCKLF
jgi:hypothetical protein